MSGIVINSLYILKTLKFNDVIIESLIGENQIEYKEETFDFFKSDSNDDEYLNIKENDDYDAINKNDGTLVDEDEIEVEETDDELND